MKDTILFGDCKETLSAFLPQSARTCVTSPPYYGLRDYGTATWIGGDPNCKHRKVGKQGSNCITGHKNHDDMGSVGDYIFKSVCPLCGAVRQDSQLGLEETPEEYIESLVSVFREVRNILTDDGTLWVNLGDSYYNYRPGKGQSYPKQSVSKTKQDLPDECNKRGNKLEGLKEKDLIGIPWMFAFAMRNDGWYLRQDIIWHKPNPMPESVKDRCTKSHEYIFLFSKNRKYFYDNEAIKEPVKKDWGTRNRTNGKYHNTGTGLQPHSGLTKSYDRKNKRSVWLVEEKSHGKYGSQENEAKHRQGIHANRGDNLIAVRTKLPTQKEFVEFLRSKTKAKILAEHTDIPLTKIEHWFRFDESGFSYPSIEDWKKVRDYIDDYNVMDEGLTYYELKTDEVVVSNTKNKRSVWSVTVKPYKEAHFATYPPDLIEPCILAGSEEGDTILDPFMGAGTTAAVAKSLNRYYIGCELNEDYGNLIQKRIQDYQPVKKVAQEPTVNILDLI